jgi:HEAT repeat protein
VAEALEAIETIQGRLTGAQGRLDLADAASVEGQLAISDPPQDGRVSVASLREPQSESPGNELTLEASPDGLDDTTPAAELEAAQLAGEQGLQELRDLVTSDQLLDAEVRSEALRLLVECAPRQMVLPVLDRILADSPDLERRWAFIGGHFHDGARSGLWRQAAAACGALRHSGATARLSAALRELDLESARVAAEVLGEIGDPAAEPALIELLAAEDSDASAAAARALGRIGTAAAVVPLRRRLDAVRADVTLKRAIRQAIEAIQSRSMGAEPGQHGLAEAAAAQEQFTASQPSQEGRGSFWNPRGEEGESGVE